MDMSVEERKAFISAYSANVAIANDETVSKFLDVMEKGSWEDNDKFYEEHSDDYSSIFDAYGVWNCAMEFAKKTKGDNENAET